MKPRYAAIVGADFLLQMDLEVALAQDYSLSLSYLGGDVFAPAAVAKN